ncbi:5-oxoprolinase subunit PxpB [Gaetbulibacter aestuarii]|uniref:5-oxoprolinase subunit PxpB n=1 Tax=Gaetbulibacter aestuarii TaxID=1502358 RepID=A0ABW7N1C7_9FLAO
MKSKITAYKPYGDPAILVEWEKKIDRNILMDILSLKAEIQNSNIKQIIELKHTYNSLIISYDSKIINLNHEIAYIDKIYNNTKKQVKKTSKLWKIPVCYEAEFGIDLDVLARSKNRSKQAVIKTHTAAPYLVYFIGFLPGFLYLGGLPEELHMARKSAPELKVPKGAVAIGGNQTGVYPIESPGGWHIIGNTPVNFFDVEKDRPCFAEPGDQVMFVPVDKKKYHDVKILVESGVYELESEVIHG